MKVLTGKLSEFYHEEFVQAAEELEIELIFVEPEQINIIFGKPSKIYDNEGNEIKVDAFFLRATNKHYKQYAQLARALVSQGCIMLDPIDRFTGNPPNKMLSTIKRAICGAGVKTLSFTVDFVRNCPQIVEQFLPIFIKPVDSSRNRGLVKVTRVNDLIPYLSTDYILQPTVDIIDEYRVLAYNGDNLKILGITHKKTIGLCGNNPKRKFKISENTFQALNDFLQSFEEIKLNKGLFGYDIAKTNQGFILIEANRSPMWERTERIRNISIAKEILLILKNEFTLQTRR